jgi:RNA 3'-terminal phosphate cyclase (ATP)
MITIDGSEGEGGGQILRTSLAWSLVTGQPFRMDRIRAKRQKHGLLRQHLTAVEAATTVGCAQVEGRIPAADRFRVKRCGWETAAGWRGSTKRFALECMTRPRF